MASNTELDNESKTLFPRGWHWWLPVVLATIGVFAFQGTRGLYESTEGRYAECTRQTVAEGSLWEPILNGEFHWSKPPLTYIAIAAGMAVVGENTWGVRLYLAVALVLTVMAVNVLGRMIWNRDAGIIAALIYATSPFPLIGANSVSTDTLLVLWIALTMMFYWCAIRRNQWIYMVLMWAMLGLAALTKGPMGFIPLFGIVPVHFLLWRQGRKMPWLINPLGLLAFLLIGMSWYAIEIYRHPELLGYWLRHETYGRMVEGEFKRNAEPYKVLLIYVPCVLFGPGLWLIPILRNGLRFPWPRGAWFRWTSWPDGLEWTYLLLSVVVPFILLSLAQSRLPLYVLPLSIPISVGLARAMVWLLAQQHVRVRTLMIVALLSTALIVLGKGVLAYSESRHDMKILAAQIRPVLDQKPDMPVVVIQNMPLNGLQFYLKQTIPASRDIDELQHASGAESSRWLLFPTKYMKYMNVYLDGGQLQMASKGKYWALAWQQKPLEAAH